MKRIKLISTLTCIILLGAGLNVASAVEVVVALRSLPETDYIVERVGDFEKETGIKVNIVTYPEQQLRQKEIMDLTTGAGTFDVFAMDSVFVPELAKAGYVVPLDDYISEEYELEDVMQAVRDLLSRDGKLYGAPIYQETTILMYRKDLFEKEGVKVPDTLEEMTQLAEKFTDPPNMYGYAMRGLRGNGMNIYIWAQWLRSYSGRFFTDLTDQRKPLFNSPEAIEATKKYAELLQKYGPPGSSSYSWDDVQTAFASGKTAMIIDATNFYNRIEDPEKSFISGKIGYAVVPKGPAGSFPGNYAMGFAISAVGAKTDEEKEAAAKFIQWATSKEMELGKALEANIVSISRKSVFESKEFQSKMAPDWVEAAKKSAEITMPNYRPLVPEWREVGDLLGIAVESVISKQQTAEDALNEAQKKAEEVMAKFK